MTRARCDMVNACLFPTPATWFLSIRLVRLVLIIKFFALAEGGSPVHTSRSEAVHNGELSTALRHGFLPVG